VNIDKVLNAFDNKPFEGEIQVVSSGTTIKSSATIEVGGWVVPNIGIVLTNDYVDFTVFNTYFAERYVRSLGIDIGAFIFETDGLSKGQLAILAALIHQRI
jgi:hypothetical protein